MPILHWLVLLAGAAGPEPGVTIQTFKFRPDTVVVAAGGALIWTNGDDVEHTVTSDSTSPLTFDGALAKKGATYRTSFAKPGTYTYHCARHEFMRGVVRVTSPGAKP